MESEDAEAPWISADELDMYYDDARLPTVALFHASRNQITDPWTPHQLVPELAMSGSNTGWPSLSVDRLTIYFESNRSGESAIYRATRATPTTAFGTIAPVVANPGWIDGDPSISADGKSLVFASDHTMAGTDSNLYVELCP